MKNLKNILAPLKDLPAYGGQSSERANAIKERIFSNIAKYESSLGRESAAFVDSPRSIKFDFGFYLLKSYVSTPVVASVLALVIVGSTGSATLAAAGRSLPGDTLYNVKIVSEQAQLKLSSLDKRAVLHTEFAGRRLQEATDLQTNASSNPETAALVESTLNAASLEIASAVADVQELQATTDDAQAALTVAATVQEKIDDLDDSISSAGELAETPAAVEEVANVQTAVDEASETATTVVVQAHESQPTALSEREVKAMFKRMMGELSGRQSFDEHRISTMKSVLSEKNDDLVTLETISVKDLTVRLESAQGTLWEISQLIDDCTSMFVAGGYRTAFEKLRVADTQLRDIESELADIEFAIIDAVKAIPEETIISETPITE